MSIPGYRTLGGAGSCAQSDGAVRSTRKAATDNLTQDNRYFSGEEAHRSRSIIKTAFATSLEEKDLIKVQA